MDALLVIVAVVFVLFCVLKLYINQHDERHYEQQATAFKAKLESIPGFRSTNDLSDPIVSGATDSLIALSRQLHGGLYFDAAKGRICVLPGRSRHGYVTMEDWNPVVYEYTQLVRAEVVNEAGSVITQSTANNVIGRAVVGGALFGGAGALVGSLTAPTTAVSSIINKPKLTLYFDDAMNAYHEIEFGRLSDANASYAKLWALVNQCNVQGQLPDTKPPAVAVVPPPLPPAEKYKVARNDKIVGEFTHSEITQHLESGLLTESDWFWNWETNEWRALSSLQA